MFLTSTSSEAGSGLYPSRLAIMSGGMLGSCLYLARALDLSTKLTLLTRGSALSRFSRLTTLTSGVVSAIKTEMVLALPLRLSMDWLKEWPRTSDTPVIIRTTNITETAKTERPLFRQKFCRAARGANRRELVNILVISAGGVVANHGAAIDDDHPAAHDVDDLLVVGGHDHGATALVDLQEQLQDVP